MRVALGAAPGDIRRLLLRDGIILVTLGAFTGLAAAAAAAWAIRSVLFAVPVLDIWAFGAAAGIVVGAAMVGCGIPAWRASRLDPVVTLRLD